MSGGHGERTDAVRDWLAAQLAERLGIAAQDVDRQRPFVDFGLTSADAVVFSGELAEWLGRPLPPTLLWEHTNIESLALHLADAGAALHPAPVRTVAVAEPVAIIGAGCRFPGADGPAAFWELLRDGVDAIREVPRERWDIGRFYDPDPAVPGRMTSRHGGFLSGIDRFDPSFFCLSQREAERMDPQQRLLLEVAWEALENAGWSITALQGSPTGVFVGISSSDYAFLQMRDPARVDAWAGTGNAHSIAANRLSYLWDLRGPSLAVDTACSSSLVAVHLACQSLAQGECDLALAGGVNVLLSPQLSIAFSKAHMMAADGRCKTFDAAADGYVRGEGCGVVVLKTLAKALADGDRVLAVIRGSAVNQDGTSNGLTAPSAAAQQAVIRAALARAGVAPSQVQYVEAHGTGTQLGDPIEMDALLAVLPEGRAPGQTCAIGSVKTNIGHLEAAAGIAGLIKVALALHHGTIPPHLHFKTLNPRIRLAGAPLEIPTSLRPWPGGARPRHAGVSAFGFGGTNAHVVLEEAPRRPPARDTEAAAAARRPELLVLSAQTPPALRSLAGRYAAALNDMPPETWGDVCSTTRRGRYPFLHRLALAAASPEQASPELAAFAAGNGPAGLHLIQGQATHNAAPRIAFLFTGQGSQYIGMGRGLYEAEPVFRDVLARCAAVLDGLIERPLLSVLYPEAGAGSPLDETAFTQPALFALQVALVALWRSWGIEPAALLGHSIGEYAAACTAGVFTLEDGLRLVAERGRLMQGLPKNGAMAAVFADEDATAAALDGWTGEVTIAALNAPAETVISGTAEGVDAVTAALQARGVKSRRLAVSDAFHSPLMEPILGAFAARAAAVSLRPPRLPLVSNVTGDVAGDSLTRPEYWARHARATVRFAAGARCLQQLGVDVCVEIGPGTHLLALLRRCLPEGAPACVPSLRKNGGDDVAGMLRGLGELWTRGAEADWQALDDGWRRRRVALPTYPFERRRCWMDPEQAEWTQWLYEPAWEKVDTPAAEAPPSLGAPAAPWLILADEGGVGTALARRLEAAGAGRSVTVARPADAGGAMRDFAARGDGRCAGVVHLWGLDAEHGTDASCAALLEAQERGCASALAALQALLAGAGSPPRLWIATRGTQPAGDRGVSSVASATLWGLGRVIALEHPEAWGGLIDLDPNPGETDASCLLRELLATGGEDQVAWRDGRRYVLRLRPLALPPLPPGDAARPLDSAAVYLITGGLGALGLQAAGWLAHRGARHLVLVGRRGLHGGAAEAVRALEGRGVTVRVAAVDVSDPEALGRLFAELRQAGRPLRGIVHAAGVSAREELRTLSASTLRDVLAAKVAGAWNLHRQSREEDLSFFICFASVSGVLGSRSLGAYAAANCFLDALAHHRRSLGLPGLSVDWGPWAEGGMVGGEEGEQLARMGMHPLASAPALDALDRLRSGDGAQVMVARIDWPRFASVLAARGPRPLLSAVAPAADAAPAADCATPRRESALAREIAAARGAEREALLVGWLQEQTASLLGLPAGAPVDLRRGFFEMGLDSLMALELKQRLEPLVGPGLPGTLALDFPNIQALAHHLAAEASPAGEQPMAPAARPAVFRDEPASPRDVEAELLRELEALHY